MGGVMTSEHKRMRDGFAAAVEEVLRASLVAGEKIERRENLIEIRLPTVAFNVIVTIKRGSLVDG
jgi:hypothetical protein